MIFTSLNIKLLNLPRTLKRCLVICNDIVICIFSVYLSFGLRLDRWDFFQNNLFLVLIIAIIISIPIFIYLGFYKTIFRYIDTSDFSLFTASFIIYSIFFSSIFTLYGIEDIPRSIGVIQPLLYFIGIGFSRHFIYYLLRDIINTHTSNKNNKKNALIYGAGLAGRQLALDLTKNKLISIIGFVDDNLNLVGNTINGIQIYPAIDIKDVIKRHKITDVFLAIPSENQNQRSKIISLLFGCKVRVRTLPTFSEIAFGQARVSDLHDLDMNDLLGRKVVQPQSELLLKNIKNKAILVTGAGGSIGSELCRQILKCCPSSLILIDNSEHSLYLIYEELKNFLNNNIADNPLHHTQQTLLINIVPCLASVSDTNRLLTIFKQHNPDTVFHVAAYKHVPLVEENPTEGIQNNVFGTLSCAQVSLMSGVSNFTLVSTDKAVRPTNIMGASKRIAELVVQGMSEFARKNNYKIIYSIVRFGNVLGSSGSVAPLFKDQIAEGGPITLTHQEVTRYFMTIPEAAQLVIQAGSLATGGDVFVLDMGDPVRIYDLAVKIVYLSGLLVKDNDHPHGDIEIKIIGLRPGEKLYEELLIGENPQPTIHPKIMMANEEFISWIDLQKRLEYLRIALDETNLKVIRALLQELVSGYRPNENPIN